MKGIVINIEEATINNTDYRRVLYTAPHSQLVVMSLKPGEDIGEEVHELDQFISIEEGEAEVALNDVAHKMAAEESVTIPRGVKHNVINTGTGDLKLYTIYSPPEHRDGVLHKTKEEALADDEHFDGTYTESV